MLHNLLLRLSVFLSWFASSRWSQTVCVAMATIMIPAFQVSFPWKAFMVFASVLLVRSRYILESFVSCYDVPVRKAFLRWFLFSATVGHALSFLTHLIIGTFYSFFIRVILLLREVYGMLKEFETRLSTGWRLDPTETEEGLVKCYARCFKLYDTVFDSVALLMSQSTSDAILPILLVPRYSEATGVDDGLEMARGLEISLKLAATTGMGLFLSTKVLDLMWSYHLETQENRASQTEWMIFIGWIIQIAREGLVQAGVYLFVGGVKAGLNNCVKCMSWTWVLWHLFSFFLLRGLLDKAQRNVLEEKTRFATDVLLPIVKCASFFLDIAFLLYVYYALVS